MIFSTKQRTAFERELLAQIGPRLKGTGWKKSKSALFNQSGDHYQDTVVLVHRNAAIISVELRFKPAALDPILWDVLDMPENRTLFRNRLASAPYSELVESHPNQVARGAYAITHVTSLINDRNYDRARQVANAYATGELSSCANLSSAGKSFHQLALEWLDAGIYSHTVLRAAAGA